LLIALVIALIAGLLIWRSRRTSDWDADAIALETDTRTATDQQLPSVLSAETAAPRALSWQSLRAQLTGLVDQWGLLADRASDERRRSRSMRIGGLLEELVAAVDAENEALAADRDWKLLRPRVDELRRALIEALAAR
jgi:hypothetical protein